MTIGIEELLRQLGDEVLAFHGSRAVTFSRPVTLDTEADGGIAYVRAGYGNAEAWIRKTRASVILAGPELATLADPPAEKAVVVVADPRLQLLRVVREHFAPRLMTVLASEPRSMQAFAPMSTSSSTTTPPMCGKCSHVPSGARW